MIATWALYAAVVGILVGAAALVGERAARALRLPIRMVWVVGCALTLLGPVAAYVAATQRQPTVGAEVGQVDALASLPAGYVRAHPPAPVGFAALEAKLKPRLEAIAATLDRPLLIAWAVASLLLLARLSASVVRLRLRQKEWEPREVDGTAVLISSDLGPAVVGLRPMRIVMPAWSLALDTPLRAVVLRHETEHRRAGDPYVLLVAALACALVPWNLALWWQARRLRLAVEIDCDARVLRDDPQVDRYGTLLLAIAQRSTARIPAAIAALTESTSDLERRIEAMTKPSRRSRRIALCCGGAAVVAIAIAFEAPIPAAHAAEVASHVLVPARISDVASTTTPPTPPRPMALVAASMPASAPARDTGQGDSVFFEFQVEHPATLASGNTPPAYPIALRAAGINGRVLVSFVVDTNGRAEMTTLKVLQVGDSRFFDAVRDHLPDMIFIPAEIGVQKVRQLVQMPFVFTLGDIGANTGGRTQPLFVVDGVPLNPDAAARMPTAAAGDSAYFEFQVERQVSAASGNTPPAYPPELRAARIEGRVLVSFVVGTDGRADMSTFKVVRTTHDLFSKAVRDHLPDMIFIPAQIGGHDVKQVVQMPFVFTLNP